MVGYGNFCQKCICDDMVLDTSNLSSVDWSVCRCRIKRMRACCANIAIHFDALDTFWRG